jgi:integrase
MSINLALLPSSKEDTMIITRVLILLASWFGRCPSKRTKNVRERYLLPYEWANVKPILDRKPIKIKTYFYLLLFEGSRMSELRYMQWRHVDLTAGIWYKPITKNGKAQTLALSQWSCVFLNRMPRVGAYVFHGERPDLPWSRTAVQYHWRKIRKAAGCPDVTIRDYRRTLGTWMINHEEDLRIIQTIMNHTDIRTTAKVYTVVNLPTQRAALDRQAERVMGK